MDLIKAQHINATPTDLTGNNGIGRYIFLTGSDERAKEISEHFINLRVLNHPRQHNLYLGQLSIGSQMIDVGSISTGIGGPSADIVINELIILGARRFLRIGTAGSMQPDRIHVGDLVIATAAVRDDKASWDYIYPEYPAVASMQSLIATHRANAVISQSVRAHYGIVHSKSSLYAREFHYSFMQENEHYMASMHLSGVLATEMECAQLFTLSSLMSERLIRKNSADTPIASGCILAIVGDKTSFSNDESKIKQATINAINLGLETVRQHFLIDQEKQYTF